MNTMVRRPAWAGQGEVQDPIRQVFDRLFEGSMFQNGSTDDSSITLNVKPRGQGVQSGFFADPARFTW